MEVTQEHVSLIDALIRLAWPIFAVMVVIKIWPEIKMILSSRSFSVKVGDLNISVQEASEQLRQQVKDLQEQVATNQLKHKQMPMVSSVIKDDRGNMHNHSRGFRPKILWVTGSFANHAYELANLKEHAHVDTVTTTGEAINKLTADKQFYNAVISGMSRREGENQNDTAGISLIEEAHKINYEGPIYIFCSEDNVRAHGAEALASGAQGVTSSTVQVFQWLWEISCKVDTK